MSDAPKGSKHARAAAADDLVTVRFRELVDQIGKARGYARGWKTHAATELGIHPTHLSRILNGGVAVGWSTAMTAAQRLGIAPDYFEAGGPKTAAAATPAKRAKEAGRLVDVRNLAIAIWQKNRGAPWTPDVSEADATELADAVLGLELVRLAREQKEAPRRSTPVALVSEVLSSLDELLRPISEDELLSADLSAEELHIARRYHIRPAALQPTPKNS